MTGKLIYTKDGHTPPKSTGNNDQPNNIKMIPTREGYLPFGHTPQGRVIEVKPPKTR